MSFLPDPLGGPIGVQMMGYINTGGYDPLATPFSPHPMGGTVGFQLATNINLIKPIDLQLFKPLACVHGVSSSYCYLCRR